MQKFLSKIWSKNYVYLKTVPKFMAINKFGLNWQYVLEMEPCYYVILVYWIRDRTEYIYQMKVSSFQFYFECALKINWRPSKLNFMASKGNFFRASFAHFFSNCLYFFTSSSIHIVKYDTLIHALENTRDILYIPPKKYWYSLCNAT